MYSNLEEKRWQKMNEEMQKIYESLSEENKNIILMVANAIKLGQESVINTNYIRNEEK